VRLHHEPQHLLGGLRLSEEPDRRVDLLREELNGTPVGAERQVLPGERRRVRGVEARWIDAKRLGAARRRGDAAPVPAVFGERKGSSRLRLELLDVRLARLVRARSEEHTSELQ